MRWFISKMLVENLAVNQANSAIQPRELRKDEMALFNKNGLRYQYFSNCHKDPTRYGWIGEADTLDPYFDQVIHRA